MKITKKVITKDSTGKKYVYRMPEFKTFPWEQGGAFDLIMIAMAAYVGYLAFAVR